MIRGSLLLTTTAIAAVAAAAPMALASTPSQPAPAGLIAAVPSPAVCVGLEPEGLTVPPAYYAVELVPTKRVPGTADADGLGRASFPSSPFGVTVTPDGEYVYDLEVEIEGVSPKEGKVYALWVTTPQLDRVELVGTLEEAGKLGGEVAWNKFLLVVSLEEAGSLGERWQGPIVLRGMSRSGRMHTMAGHGPYQAEPCVKYGY